MVNWSDAWLEKVDVNNVIIKLWATRKNSEFVKCNLCGVELKYSKCGFQALMQHSKKPKHKQISDIRFSNSTRHFSNTTTTTIQETTTNKQQRTIALDHSLNTKISNAEAVWLF